MDNLKALRGFRNIYGDEIERFALIEKASRTYLASSASRRSRYRRLRRRSFSREA
jgi:hypothetical protein